MSVSLPNNGPSCYRQYVFSQGYGCEAVIPLKIQTMSLIVVMAIKMTEGDNDQLRLQELEALDEKRLQAQQRNELYQARISKVFSKKIKESLPERKLSHSCKVTHDHDT